MLGLLPGHSWQLRKWRTRPSIVGWRIFCLPCSLSVGVWKRGGEIDHWVKNLPNLQISWKPAASFKLLSQLFAHNFPLFCPITPFLPGRIHSDLVSQFLSKVNEAKTIKLSNLSSSFIAGILKCLLRWRKNCAGHKDLIHSIFWESYAENPLLQYLSILNNFQILEYNSFLVREALLQEKNGKKAGGQPQFIHLAQIYQALKSPRHEMNFMPQGCLWMAWLGPPYIPFTPQY